MDVYLIPVGLLEDDRYELYCEHIAADEALSDGAPQGSGRIAAIFHRFKAAVARVEREQQSGGAPEPRQPRRWMDRMKRKTLCWVAEKIAEQRLLWRLRHESRVTLFFPGDISADEARVRSRAMLQHEADRHLKWTIIDGLLFCLSGVVALIPGPNPLAYYFGFRFVGHFLSRRGARHGLDNVQWDLLATSQLSRLRDAIPLPRSERARHVREIASALHLQHLGTFFERTAIPAA